MSYNPECDPERVKGFITNFEYSLRQIIALRLAGLLHKETVQIKNNATDVHNRPIEYCRALYVPGARDLTDFWNTVRKIKKFLRVD